MSKASKMRTFEINQQTNKASKLAQQLLYEYTDATESANEEKEHEPFNNNTGSKRATGPRSYEKVALTFGIR